MSEIISIDEISNPNQIKTKPIKEKQDIYIPGIIDQNIPRRNGEIACFCGSGGSGKTSLMLNMFKSKNQYYKKFDNIFYFCPEASFRSVQNHPFENHNNLYHELTVELLENVYETCYALREDYDTEMAKKPEDREYEEKPEISYNCIIIDDFANALKDNDIQIQLNKMIIKSRHLCLFFVFTLQSLKYMPFRIRSQISYLIQFQLKNKVEFESIALEFLMMNKNNSLILERYIFDEKYNHMDINNVDKKIYKNFNYLVLNEN
jgi:hypothetical protein